MSLPPLPPVLVLSLTPDSRNLIFETKSSPADLFKRCPHLTHVHITFTPCKKGPRRRMRSHLTCLLNTRCLVVPVKGQQTSWQTVAHCFSSLSFTASISAPRTSQKKVEKTSHNTACSYVHEHCNGSLASGLCPPESEFTFGGASASELYQSPLSYPHYTHAAPIQKRASAGLDSGPMTGL